MNDDDLLADPYYRLGSLREAVCFYLATVDDYPANTEYALEQLRAALAADQGQAQALRVRAGI